MALLAGSSMRCNLPWVGPASPQTMSVAFQSLGDVRGSALDALGGVKVQTRSAGRGWFRQMSTAADEMDCKLQVWLSQFTEMPAGLLSGIAVPEAEGCAAHKLGESQLAEVVPWVPPPQLASKAAVKHTWAANEKIRMHNSARQGLGLAGKPKVEEQF